MKKLAIQIISILCFPLVFIFIIVLMLNAAIHAAWETAQELLSEFWN